MRLCGLQVMHKPTLLLPQSCLIVVSVLGSVWDSGVSPADLHRYINDVQSKAVVTVVVISQLY